MSYVIPLMNNNILHINALLLDNWLVSSFSMYLDLNENLLTFIYFDTLDYLLISILLDDCNSNLLALSSSAEVTSLQLFK